MNKTNIKHRKGEQSTRLIQIQTFATKKIQPTELCFCVDLHICLNRESVVHSRRKPMTRLVHAQSKLSEKNTNKTTQEKLNREAAFRESYHL